MADRVGAGTEGAGTAGGTDGLIVCEMEGIGICGANGYPEYGTCIFGDPGEEDIGGRGGISGLDKETGAPWTAVCGEPLGRRETG